MSHPKIPPRPGRNPDREARSPLAASAGLPGRWGTLALLVLLAGCMFLPPSAKDWTAIHAGEKALVLVRIQCTVDDQPFEPCIYNRKGPLLSDNIFVGLAMGSFDTFGRPGYADVRALSEASFDDGWALFILPPGIYYLHVRGPDSGEVAKRGARDYYDRYFRDPPRWRIDIPEGAKGIYAGTLHLAGRVRGTLMFGDKIIDPVDQPEISLSDDREPAARLWAEHASGAGEIRTLLMRKWPPGEPIILRSPLPAPNR